MRRIFWGFAEIGSSWVPYTTFRAFPILASNSQRYSYIRKTTTRYHRDGESPTPRISDTGSRQLPASLIRGVANSPHHWYAELATPCITNRESQLLNFSKKTLPIDDTESRRLPAPVIQWVADSPYRWVGESPTPRITDTESQRLCLSLS